VLKRGVDEVGELENATEKRRWWNYCRSESKMLKLFRERVYMLLWDYGWAFRSSAI